ncbi:ATP-binding protein [Polyangium sp. y55x31]|uniref:ATP-binding protein n=1 Tax=Polyangium sp. y55x31 TaxID=3042688 RepID=UPI0024826E4A|nr:ATP-binding protein [Polyangium sp. y55x31]MDI1479146.1 GAF domain-containing protein [Polyangium sp. y55x31]
MDETNSEVEALRREIERLKESERAAQKLQVELAGKVRALETFARRASLLAKVTTAMARASTVQEVADAVTTHGHELFGASASLLFLLDEDDGRWRALTLTSATGAPPEHAEIYQRVPLDHDLPLTHAVRNGEAVWLEGHEAVLAAFPAAASMRRGNRPLEGIVALPLRTTHAVVGGLAFSFFHAVPTFDSVTRDFFMTVCNQCGLAVERAFSFEAERRAREAQQKQQERLAVLVQASERLASSLESRHALAALVRLVVPRLADWCAIDELAPDGTIRRLAVEHRDAQKVALAHELVKKYPPNPNAAHGVANVLRTGKREWVPEIPDALLVETTVADEQLALVRSLGLTSYAVVPLVARGRVLGALTLAGEGQRRLDVDDLAFAEDLSRRAALALDNARLYEAAEAAWAELHGLFMEAPAGICILRGKEHRFELANAPYLELASRTDVVGKTIREVFPELENQGIYELLDRVYHTGTTFRASELPLRIDNGDGPEERIYTFVYQAIRDGGTISGIAVYAFEVTEPVRARRRVEALVESLAQTNRELDQFAYITSHDLKAPLRAIGSLAEWIEEDLGPAMTEDARKKMALLRGRVRRMEALIQGILDFSRAGRLSTSRETVDVGRLVTEIVEMLGVRPPAAVVLDGDLPTLVTERIALEQVFTNLLGNAIEHARRPDVRVHVEARDAGETWEFFVRDDGPGIAPEFHERIWGIFQTLEAQDKVESKGIGLAIVKKIVEGRGGRARVESAPGHGACFSFTWPKRADSPNA